VGRKLAAFTFWGWMAVIVLAAVTLPLGYTSSKEYAELEWPIDLLITVVWVSYALVFFGTVIKRKTKHIYVSNWFFRSLHPGDRDSAPGQQRRTACDDDQVVLGLRRVQDAMVQWWYGHNAVGFFLTTAFLGMMYYFIPKQAGRPIYSYRLSVVHFWSLNFIYMWAGPHHLQYTALPDWRSHSAWCFP